MLCTFYTFCAPLLHMPRVIDVCYGTFFARYAHRCALSLCACRKPWFSGEYHTIKGEIFKVGAGGKRGKDDVVYTLTGKWTGALEAVHVPTGTRKQIIKETSTAPSQEPIVRPISEQGELESQRVWSSTADALRVEDYGTAMKEKTAVEEHQRKLRRERDEAGETWEPKYFRNVTDPAHLIEEVDRRKDGKEGTCYWEYIHFPKVDGSA